MKGTGETDCRATMASNVREWGYYDRDSDL